MLAGRYRIYGLLGVGGMGEVFRADDLKLGQAVALKFLPRRIEADPAYLARFLAEARIARQISHPNVCRVYDVGEVDGHHFLSMEYVDGEDLRSLLRRIGRLPRDKALQIARQLCSGVAAAHEQGVLHRDLKPANIMIDGRGRTKIADFGLAILAQSDPDPDRKAGTPLYMAPEQLAGRPATVATDVYALGLILYEIFTGRTAFESGSIADLLRVKTESAPTNPSKLVENLDPAVERVILRCLASEPSGRPASAAHVALSLPGGDPLAAALAAGETPSPELVAEAGAVGGLRPGAAIACIGALAATVGLVILFSAQTQLSRIVPLPKSPEVLAERARDLLLKVGQRESPRDTLYAFEYDSDRVDYHLRTVPAPQVWERLSQSGPTPILFWYRQSPQPLVAYDRGIVNYGDPPRLVSGMAGVMLEPDGRLAQIDIVPPEADEARDTGGPAVEPSWTLLFEEAGLDPSVFTRVEPERLPPIYADTRAAWEGPHSALPDVRIRVEAAGYHGTPVSFRILGPWASTASVPSTEGVSSRLFTFLLAAVILAILIGGALIARRNVRLGRGDRRGASTFALFMLAVLWLSWVLKIHHVAQRDELWIFLRGLSSSVFFTSVAWVCYLALEPYVRRTWPDVLVSWVRLLEGRFHDPLVGRDVLLGLLAGSSLTILRQAWPLGSRWLGWPAPPFDTAPFWMEFENLSYLRHAFANLLELSAANPFFNVIYIVSLLLLNALLRNRAWALVVYILFWSVLAALPSPHPYLQLVFAMVLISIIEYCVTNRTVRHYGA